MKDLEQEKVKRVELASKTGLAASGWNFGSLFKGIGQATGTVGGIIRGGAQMVPQISAKVDLKSKGYLNPSLFDNSFLTNSSKKPPALGYSSSKMKEREAIMNLPSVP